MPGTTNIPMRFELTRRVRALTNSSKSSVRASFHGRETASMEYRHIISRVFMEDHAENFLTIMLSLQQASEQAATFRSPNVRFELPSTV